MMSTIHEIEAAICQLSPEERAVLRAWLAELDDERLAATYEAQSEAAGRAGWDDPQMSDYDNYDENRKKQ